LKKEEEDQFPIFLFSVKAYRDLKEWFWGFLRVETSLFMCILRSALAVHNGSWTPNFPEMVRKLRKNERH
jgi:hypothetical protein